MVIEGVELELEFGVVMKVPSIGSEEEVDEISSENLTPNPSISIWSSLHTISGLSSLNCCLMVGFDKKEESGSLYIQLQRNTDKLKRRKF